MKTGLCSVVLENQDTILYNHLIVAISIIKTEMPWQGTYIYIQMEIDLLETKQVSCTVQVWIRYLFLCMMPHQVDRFKEVFKGAIIINICYSITIME